MDYRNIRGNNRNMQMNQQLQRRTGQTGNNPPQAGAAGNSGRMLQEKFSRGILGGIQPGNIGDINRVIWPFAFQFQSQNGAVIDIAPGQSQTLSFSVTQEAGFLMRQISHSTFRLAGGLYSYIDPFYFDESSNSPNGLTYTMQDAVSSRLYTGSLQGRTVEEVSNLGNANVPTIFPSTIFLLPNQTMLMNLSNSGTETFRTFITVWGYRIRVEDAQKILSTVSINAGA